MQVELTDTHCHIQSIGASDGEKTTRELWNKSDVVLSEVISRAKEAGVNRLIAVGCDPSDSLLVLDLALKFDDIWASIGIHPHEAKVYSDQQSELANFSKLAGSPKVVAIGECGLDYYYEHSPRADQLKMLEYQLELALANNLPLIFHVRDAYDDFWSVFDRYNSKKQPIRGVLHSFTDNHKNLELALERGLYIGVNGIATFAKNTDQTEMYAQIPLSNLVLETDSPFLTPSPFRGTINEPKNVRIIAEFLANLRGISLEQLANLTTSNSRQLFGI